MLGCLSAVVAIPASLQTCWLFLQEADAPIRIHCSENAIPCHAMQCNTMPSLASISQSGTPHVYYAMCPVMTIAPIGHFAHLTCSSRTQKDGHKTEQASATPASVRLSNAVPADMLNDQDCLFLGGVQLHLCCCNPEEQLQLVRIAREGCALRHTDLSPGLTHIVVRTLLRP